MHGAPTSGTLRRDHIKRTITWPAVDSAIWIFAVYASVWMRYDFRAALVFTGGVASYALLAAIIHGCAGTLVGPYRVRHRRGSMEEITDLARTFIITLPLLFITPWLSFPHPVPRSTAISAGALAMLTMLAARLISRARRMRAARHRGGRPALVYGAGDAGDRIIRSLLTEDDSPLTPVGIIDDDPAKARLRIHGIRVVGDRSDLADSARQWEAQTLILAMPSAPAEVIREVSASARNLGLEVLVAPSMSEIVDHSPGARDLRDLDLADVLGRPPVHLEWESISSEITGKVVLVTGAGGSIGSELCRQIARFSPTRLLLLDHDESGMHATDMSIRGDGLLCGGNIILADIRDAARIREIMAQEKPDIVYHAAALKHLPLLEAHPFEAWKSNVMGTRNVLAAADAAEVTSFVNISTDKAAAPTSMLGLSKRFGEVLTAWYAAAHGRRYVSVRFGNVLGSRGSVVHAFTSQIASGGPVTITDPRVERYFMLIPEACQLVLQAGVLGHGGEVMVLEMGAPVKIADLAETLIELSGRHDVSITYTGLRPGEKLSEELFDSSEVRHRTGHELVNAVQAPPLNPHVLETLSATDDASLRAWMSSVLATLKTEEKAVQAVQAQTAAAQSVAAQHSPDRSEQYSKIAHERGGAHIVDVPGGFTR
ncbi:nucleoside-diphosphate sugar epimerase/dehydratase [Dermatophilus congolensis]|uniref:polysaccharide biosynthesis protein n=1 Tax=Dermatophilus congolensis TaxID=1863 RepID=UPI00312C8560